MWFESTPLVPSDAVKTSRKSRKREERHEALFRAATEFVEFGLCRASTLNDVVIDGNARVIDVHGHSHRNTDDTLFTNECVLGITGDAWQSDGFEINYFSDTAVTRFELVDAAKTPGTPGRRVIWTVTWQDVDDRYWSVLNSHASFIK